METDDTTIGSNLQRLRAKTGFSQTDVADYMRAAGWKWSQATVWAVESGTRPLRLAETIDLANMFETGVHSFTWNDEPAQIRAALANVEETYSAAILANSHFENAYNELARMAAGVTPLSGTAADALGYWASKRDTLGFDDK